MMEKNLNKGVKKPWMHRPAADAIERRTSRRFWELIEWAEELGIHNHIFGRKQ
jgi:hypothetical protein